MNQALAFGLLLAGGVVLEAGLTGKGPGAVLQGKAGAVPKTGTTLSVAGAGTAIAGAATAGQVNAATGATLPGGRVVGQVTSGDLSTLAGAHGWDASQIADWVKVITQESNGDPNATNRSSGAYGIAQGITGPSWYAAHGGDSTTVVGQLTAMANYISQRYGTPAAAWAHEQEFNWY
jgi:hypothetical protein